MKQYFLTALAFLTVGVTAAVAQSATVTADANVYNRVDLSRYSDAPWTMETDVAVSVLTELDVLRGNDDGTFRADTTLNRAEFVTIAMRLLGEQSGTIALRCFPDVDVTDWYAEAVCRAKASGIVRGNVREGVPANQWRFEPARAVQFEEAVKVLAKIYALPVTETDGVDWYVPFIAAAEQEGIIDMNLLAGDNITRGEMARLTASFYAHSKGELALLRSAQHPSSSSSSSSQSSQSSSTSSQSSMSSMSSSSVSSGSYDPYTDTSVRADILLMGEVSRPLAGVRFFSGSEPINVDRVTVKLTSTVDSIESILVYGEDGLFLGTASSTDGGMTFTTTVPNGRYILAHNEERSMYVRARLKGENSGGVSGETVEVDTITVTGTGEFSNSVYTKSAIENFVTSQTALARISAVTNAGATNNLIISGDEQTIGNFLFEAEAVGINDARITSLTFNIQQTGDVSLSNVELGLVGVPDRTSCSATSTTITCSSIPASIGTVDGSQNIRVYADVDIQGSISDAALSITLNQAGSVSSAGAITWTDGETTFQWVPLESPVVRGTQFN